MHFGASLWCFPYSCLFLCRVIHLICILKTHSKAVWPLASNKDLLIPHWWLTRVAILVWRGYRGKHFSFNYTTVSRRVSCRSLVFQAWAELLQIREQCDSAEMLHCGETWSSGYMEQPIYGLQINFPHLSWRWKYADNLRELVRACTHWHTKLHKNDLKTYNWKAKEIIFSLHIN